MNLHSQVQSNYDGILSMKGGPAGFTRFLSKGGTIKDFAKQQRINAKRDVENSLLSIGEFEEIDQDVASALSGELFALADISGLRKPFNSFGILSYTYQFASGMGPAEQALEAIQRSDLQKLEYSSATIPVPVTYLDWRYGARALAASRRNGSGLDIEGARSAGEAVGIKLEQSVLFGSSVKVTNEYGVQGQAYGYTTHPSRITGTYTAVWTDSSNRKIEQDLNKIAKLFAQKKIPPPYTLYVSLDVYTALNETINPDKNRTWLNFINEDPRFDKITWSYHITSSDIVAVKRDPRFVQLGVTSNVYTIMWDDGSGMLIDFKTLGIMVPIIKSRFYRMDAANSDQFGTTAGIVHLAAS